MVIRGGKPVWAGALVLGTQLEPEPELVPALVPRLPLVLEPELGVVPEGATDAVRVEALVEEQAGDLAEAVPGRRVPFGAGGSG